MRDLREAGIGASRLETRRNTANLSTTTAFVPELQCEIIDFFADVLPLIGLPKSASRIYGLLFSSTVPLCFREITARLRISSGSVSQGLRMLREIGAVRTVYFAGGRKDYFEAESDLRGVIKALLRNTLRERLLSGEDRLERIGSGLRTGSPWNELGTSVLQERLQMLQDWNRRLNAALPSLLEALLHCMPPGCIRMNLGL